MITREKLEELKAIDTDHLEFHDAPCGPSEWKEILDTIDALLKAMKSIQDKVNEQAEDEGLWSVPFEGLQPIVEAYLQQELRKLHAVIEEAFDATEPGGVKP